MEEATKFFSDHFKCSLIEARDCHHMTIECMQAYAQSQVEKYRRRLIENIEGLTTWYCDGDAYEPACWMSPSDEYETGEYIELNKTIEIIKK